jgi:hypothetical protein
MDNGYWYSSFQYLKLPLGLGWTNSYIWTMIESLKTQKKR